MSRWFLAVVCALAPVGALAQATTLVPSGALWRYLDDGSDQGTAWREFAFDDSAWAEGPAELGYGDGDEETVVQSGPADAHFTTSYFRHGFEVASPASQDLVLALRRDDGAVVYLNGTEVFRTNMPAGEIDSLTLASSNASSSGEDDYQSATLNPCLLVAGENVLAVEVHQASPTSADVSFDLSLEADAGVPALVRPPYLQRAQPTTMTVRWRTDEQIGRASCRERV